jgi:hypothetical protein
MAYLGFTLVSLLPGALVNAQDYEQLDLCVQNLLNIE